MQLGTEFKERSEWRYMETFAGLFWILALPAAAVVIIIKIVHSQLSEGEIVCSIFALIAMALLEIAAVKIFSEGLYGFYRHKKTAIIVYDDCVEIFLSKKRFKTVSRTVNYNDIRNFYTVTGRSPKYGTIFFDIADEKKYFAVTIYNAKAAAELILQKIDFDQIDHGRNDVKIINN
ncbi:MAG: hypothetical protein K2G96_00255 [Clostridia bacterium]|nr:hypothetical protein [Clostridia bacterium]